MFGGYGIFASGKMFGIVNSQGKFFLKADDASRSRFEEWGPIQHGKMPYFSVPGAVLEEDSILKEWAKLAVKIAQK